MLKHPSDESFLQIAKISLKFTKLRLWLKLAVFSFSDSLSEKFSGKIYIKISPEYLEAIKNFWKQNQFEIVKRNRDLKIAIFEFLCCNKGFLIFQILKFTF